MTTENTTMQAIHEAYIRESKCELSYEQFITLLTFYPALLVVAVDGEIDYEEGIYVKHIAKFMANSHALSEHYQRTALEKQFYKNLMYLYEHANQWQGIFLQTLREYLREVPLLKENILEVMIMFADSSNGISQEEYDLIQSLAHQLGIDASLLNAAY
jgi:tellurite resistance protein